MEVERKRFDEVKMVELREIEEKLKKMGIMEVGCCGWRVGIFKNAGKKISFIIMFFESIHSSNAPFLIHSPPISFR